MAEAINVDREAIRSMVEDFWRSFLTVVRNNPQLSREIIIRFDERVQATASLMPHEQASTFLQMVDEEREILFNEYKRSPSALKHRLGLTAQSAQPIVIHQQQGLGEMAVRTAVRATVWESVFALFRMFR